MNAPVICFAYVSLGPRRKIDSPWRCWGSWGDLFAEAESDPGVRCVLLSGEGDDFCAGADVADVIPAWARGKNPFRTDQINPMGVSGPRRSKVFVTVVQGRVANGGLELALASDVCIAAADASFAFEEIRYGTYPIGGGLFRFIRAAGWSSAMRYALTGDTFDAPAALRMQLVAQVIPREEAETVALALALRISKGAPLALRAAIDHARAWAEGGEVAGFARSIPDMLDLLQSSDVAEAMQAMQENRAPKFTGR
jgi:enoyl-CoA hydratase/carnithine racemase